MKKSIGFLRVSFLAGLGAASMLASAPLSYADSVDPAVSADHKVDVPEEKGQIDFNKQYNFSAGYMSTDGGKLGAPEQGASASASVNHPVLILGGNQEAGETLRGSSTVTVEGKYFIRPNYTSEGTEVKGGLFMFGNIGASGTISPAHGLLTRNLRADLLSLGIHVAAHDVEEVKKREAITSYYSEDKSSAEADVTHYKVHELPWLTFDAHLARVGVVDERDAMHGNQKTGISLTVFDSSFHVVKENKAGLPIELCAGVKLGEFIGAGRLFGAESIGGSDPGKTDAFVSIAKLNACMGVKLGAVGLLRGEVNYGADKADVATAKAEKGIDKRYSQYLGGAISLENIGSPKSPVYVRAEAQRKITENDQDSDHDTTETRMGVSAGFAF